MESITNIHLLDANRQNSDEYLAGDDTIPACWTNSLSDGLKLNPGDKVSVSYSCINEVGCGGGQIETKGKNLSKSFTYKRGKFTNDKRGNPQAKYEFGPIGDWWSKYENEDVIKMPKDNEFNVSIAYYKNVNGENYIHLPRRYDSKIDISAPLAFDEIGNAQGEGPTGWGKDSAQKVRIWGQGDGTTNGRPNKIPQVRCFDDWHWYMGAKRYIPYSNVIKYGMRWRGDSDDAKTEGTELEPCSVYWDENRWKQKNDNSRYTIYMLEDQYWSGSSQTTWADSDSIAFDRDFYRRDPAVGAYQKYIEFKEYEVHKGFNDPNNVAYQLTSQFSDPKLGPEPLLTHQSGYDTTADTGLFIKDVADYPCPYSMVSRGETYKPFPAGNFDTWARGTKPTDAGATDDTELGAYACFHNGKAMGGQTGSSDAIKNKKRDDIVKYMSSYNCIGVKRPEFVDAGKYAMLGVVNFIDPYTGKDQWSQRALNEYTPYSTFPWWYLHDGVANPSLYTDNWLVTTIPWKKDNLLGLSKWFKSQKLYPELLDFPVRNSGCNQVNNTDLLIMDTPPVQANLLSKTPFEKRFIHVNPFNHTDEDIVEGKFGDDMDGLTSPTGTGSRAWVSKSTASLPVFFYYDETMEDTYVEDTVISKTSPNAGEGSLCYGFARRLVDDVGNEWVTFNTQGLPEELMNMGGDGVSPATNNWSGNYIGYDFHFNAYGNSTIALYSGVLPLNSDSTQMVGQNLQGDDVVGGFGLSAGPSESLYRNGRLVQPMGFSTSKLIRETYIGAIDPLIQFLSANSRFTFQGLHTPELIQNGNNAGQPLTSGTTVSTEEDAGTEVYKINKRLTMWNNYTPEVLPYRDAESYTAPYWKAGDVASEDDQGGKWHFNVIGQVRGSMVSQNDSGDPNGYLMNGMNSADPNNYATPGNNGDNSFQVPSTSRFAGKAETGNTTEGMSRPIDAQHQYEEMNNNLSPFIIYDSHSGIYLEDFGIDNERDWEKSLFGIMGLSWKQMNPDKISTVTQMNRQSRLTRVNYNQMKPLTTCSLVPQKDLPTCIKNLWQKTMYSTQLPTTAIASLFYGFVGDYWYKSDAIDDPWETKGDRRRFFYIGDVNMPQVYPEVVNPQTSHSIMAEGLPIKMSSPYYLVKSDILSDSYYLRDKTPLQIVAVINKENLFGDFAFSQQSQLEYTVTQQTTITKIRTEIFESDMTYAKVGNNSGVIYKVVKQIQTNPNLIQQLLKPDGDPKKGTIDMNINSK